MQIKPKLWIPRHRCQTLKINPNPRSRKSWKIESNPRNSQKSLGSQILNSYNFIKNEEKNYFPLYIAQKTRCKKLLGSKTFCVDLAAWFHGYTEQNILRVQWTRKKIPAQIFMASKSKKPMHLSERGVVVLNLI